MNETAGAGIGELGNLTDEHRRVLVEEHALSHDVVDRFQFTTGSKGILIPWSNGTDTVLVGRLDPQHRRPGQPKYLWPGGHTTFLGIHIGVDEDMLADGAGGTALIVEGTLQSYAAASWAPSGMAVIGMQGADGVHRQTDLSWAKGLVVVLLLDADYRTNDRVGGAVRRVTALLLKAGAFEVRVASLPENHVQGPNDGLDDVLARLGPAEREGVITGLVDQAEVQRVVDGAGETMTDAGISASLVADRMLGRYRWSPGLGWASWDGKRWAVTNLAEVEELARAYALEKWRQATRQQADLMARASKATTDTARTEFQAKADALSPVIKSWHGYQAVGKVAGIVKMARGIDGVLTRDDEYDSYPDLLNTQTGVVDLKTGELRGHDARLLFTKITSVGYRPGATHEEWDAALGAIPEDIREWMQLRMGQGVTGHTPGDDAMLVMDGDGRNGKTTFCEAIRYALGRDDSYAVLVSHRAVIGDPSQHPTELMAFRGARLAFLEETPEEHRLNVTRLKTLLGVSTMRARLMRQDEVSWQASHSLVLNTNYLPHVVETDHGTWRRLVRVRWPYTFVAEEEAAGRPLAAHERVGRDGIRERLRTGEEGRGEAILAWLVAGAMRWYAAGQVMPSHPQRVVADTTEWRSLTDELGEFAADRVTFGLTEKVSQAVFTREFTAWLVAQNQRPWSAKLIASRVRAHGLFTQHSVEVGVSKMNGVATKVWLGMRLRDQGDDGGVHGLGPTMPDLGKREPVTSVTSDSVPLLGSLSRGGSGREVTEVTDEISVTSGGAAVYSQPVLGPPPKVVVFDLETAGRGVDLWRAPQGEFVKITGWQDGSGVRVAPGARAVTELAGPGGPVLAGHNVMGFDFVALARHHGLDLWELTKQGRVIDTMLTWIISNPPRGGVEVGKILKEFSLDRIGERVFGVGKTDSFARLAAKFGGPGLIPVDDPEYLAYCAGDVELTAKLVATVVEKGWLTPYAVREHLVAAAAANMRLNGFRVDVGLVEQRIAEGEERRQRILTWMRTKHGLPEGGSAPQRSDAGRAAIASAFAALGVELPTTPSGKPSSAKDVMQSLTEHANPNVVELANAVLSLNGIRTIYGTIQDNLVGDRVHPNVTMYQASGRWSITEPGLTVVGKRGGRHVERNVFLPEPGHVILAADLSQIDARAVAAHCGDLGYAELFQPGRDLHGEIAERVWGTRESDVRFRAKAIGHGWNYGMGVAKLGEIAGSTELAVQFDQAMRENYPGLVEWKSQVSRVGEAGGTLLNAWGRALRPDPERAWTQAPALIGQSTARDAMMQWLINVTDEPRMRSAVRALVHDEIVVSVPADDAQDAARFLLDALPGPLVVGDGPEIPVTAEVSRAGSSWGAVYEK